MNNNNIDRNINNKINNSKLDLNDVVLQHKKEYMKKRHRSKLQKLMGTNKTQSYLDFLLKRRNKDYPRFYANPLDYKKQLNKYFQFRKTNNYSRYENLQEEYKHKTIFRIIFSRTGFKDYYMRELVSLHFRVRATKVRRRFGKLKRSRFGLRLGFVTSFKTFYFKCFFPSKLIEFLHNQERISLGSGPFTETGRFFLDDAERLLLFHRYYLQQYQEFLIHNKKIEKTFKTLENYLGSQKYTHDVLTTMPGARWDKSFFLDSINEGIFDLKNNEHVLKPDFNFEDQDILTELDELTNEITVDFNVTINDILFHLEADNWTYFYNLSLTDLDDRPPVWRYFTKIWYGLDKEIISELNDDYFYNYKLLPYCTVPLFFPGFYTKRKRYPYRVAGYQPWTRKARYVPYIRTMFTSFQLKRYQKDLIIKKSRLQISLLTKVLVFSFVFFLVFL